MRSEGRRRISPRWVAVAIALTAILAFALREPEPWSLTAELVAVVVVILLLLMLRGGLLEEVLCRRCPRCGRWATTRSAVVAFGDRFYRCSACGARSRRRTIGWADASGPEFDPYYAPRPAENPWTSAAGQAPDDDLVVSPTHSSLLENKLRRNPNAPVQGPRADDTAPLDRGSFPRPDTPARG